MNDGRCVELDHVALKPRIISFLSLAAVAWFALKPAERFPEYVPWLVPILALEKIAGPVTHVRDGDTIEVGGHAIRFGSLDCAELGTTAGQRAKTEMQRLVGGAYLVCRTNGRRSHDRWIGSCSLPDGKDLAGIMIARNICHRYW